MATPKLTPQQEFIVTLYPSAVRIGQETGMSWELILAQAAQETGWGQKVLEGTNNLFNIKASPGWKGETRTFNVWEIENGRKVWKDQPFRVYGSVEEALRDRVEFLRDNPRYGRAGLFDPQTLGNFGREARALQRAGYATDPAYAENLERVFNGRTMQSALAVARANARDRAAPEHEANRSPEADLPRSRGASGSSAIYEEAYQHFIAPGNTFEYGRSDLRSRNAEGNGQIDRSRNELDADGDGLKGVDCSSFVWRALKNAGFDVPPNTAAAPFTTHDLFYGSAFTRFARERFDIISAGEANDRHGPLERGDIICFRIRGGTGQHVGIFSGYDAQGHAQFIGSQVGHGPGAASAAPGTYWNGGRFEIVGALRAKPEFQVRAPVHAHQVGIDEPAIRELPSSPDRPSERSAMHPAAEADGSLRFGEKGPAVETLQRRLADLGYRGEDDRPLKIDGDFGANTRHAVREFQRDHGVRGIGAAGPNTAVALDRAEGALMSHPCNAHHALYTQVLEKVHAEERARGLASGHHSQRIAAALAVECLREGISRVDRVEFSHDVALARAVQVSTVRDEPGLNRSTDGISTAQAAQQTLLESTEQIRQVAVNVQAQQRDQQHRALEQQSARAQPALP